MAGARSSRHDGACVKLWRPAYVGIGSNLGDSTAIVAAAIERLGRIDSTRLVARSSLYRTPAFGPVAQPEFINAAAGLLSQLEPHALLRALRMAELELGREPTRVKWGPRVIDLDLLVCGSLVVNDDELTLPHPGIAARSFVLYPLTELAPDLNVPGVGRISVLTQSLGAATIERLALA